MNYNDKKNNNNKKCRISNLVRTSHQIRKPNNYKSAIKQNGLNWIAKIY
jgi:hypothetical protein